MSDLSEVAATAAHPKLQVSEEVAIQMTAVHKWYGEFHVLKDINLKVNSGERIVICGPSGSGKSTLIRCINHLEEHQAGEIVVGGIPLTQDVKRIEQIRTGANAGSSGKKSVDLWNSAVKLLTLSISSWTLIAPGNTAGAS